MIRLGSFGIVVVLALFSIADEISSTNVDFSSVAQVRETFIPKKSKWQMDWSRCINSHGREENTTWTVYWSDGSTSFGGGHHQKNCGTLYAVPVSDFDVEQSFKYKNNGVVKEGKVVAVEISIVCTSPNVDETVLRRTVLNYVESGVNLPRIAPKANNSGDWLNRSKQTTLKDSSGKSIQTKAGRILSLKNAVKRRFGADQCVYMEGDSKDGKIRILALGCNPKRERQDVTPMTMQ